MQRHTIVFSDFHLSPAAQEDGVWMLYRTPQFFVDDEYAETVEALLAELGDEPCEIVFNGDMFELDGADGFRGRGGRSDRDVGLETAEADSLDRILRDHAGFVAATGRLLARAERMVFLAGNHDVGLYWPAVQEVLRRHLVAAAAPEAPDVEELGGRLVFRQWFHRTGDGIFIEHGQQYDPASAVPDALVPTRGDGRGLWLSFGSAGFRHVLGGIGTMNPHDHNTFIMSLFGYARHFTRYYLGKGRSIIRTWMIGSLRCARHMLGQRAERAVSRLEEREAALQRCSRNTELSPRKLRALRALHARPVTDRPYAVLRELWLDRVALGAVVGLVALIALLALPWPFDLIVTALLGLGFWAYERFAPASDIMGFEDNLPEIAAAITHHTRDEWVVFGHTHNPVDMPMPGGRGRYLNTGSWSPSFLDPECTVRAVSHHTFAWLRSESGSVVGGNLILCDAGRFLTYEEALERAAVAAEEPTDVRAAA